MKILATVAVVGFLGLVGLESVSVYVLFSNHGRIAKNRNAICQLAREQHDTAIMAVENC